MVFTYKGGYKEVRKMEREQTTIRLPIDLKKKIQQEADKIGISFNELVIKLLHEGLDSYLVIST